MSYEHRKAHAVLRVRDGQGAPVANAKLHLEQREHDFGFGCGAFDAIPYTNEKKGDPFFRDRMEKWLRLFNYGTMSFYWGYYEPEEGKPRFESRMNASRYLVENGKRVKGHPLCWHTACAD